MMIKGRAYDCCSACSEPIIKAYRENEWDFVKRALNEKGYVEELSGLAEVQRRATAVEEGSELDWSESEEDAAEA
jgi:ubiquitin-like modifier-activating enzyme ATG7